MYEVKITFTKHSKKYSAICQLFYNGRIKKALVLTDKNEKKQINGNSCIHYSKFQKIFNSITKISNLNQLFKTGIEIKATELPKELSRLIENDNNKITLKVAKADLLDKIGIFEVTKIGEGSIPVGLSATAVTLIFSIALNCAGAPTKNPKVSNSDVSSASDVVSNDNSNSDGMFYFDTIEIDLSYLLNRETNSYPKNIEFVLNQSGDGKNCKEIIYNYCKEFGIDPRIIIAIACQESRDGHNPNAPGTAIGQMQIEKAVWVNKTLSVTNAKGNKVEVNITLEDLKDLDFNIKIGCMILKHYLEITDYNLPLALACYNMGPGTMRKITGENNLKNVSPTRTDWIEAMEYANCGDPEYIKHIMEWLEHLGLDKPYILITKEGETIHIDFCLERKKVATK